MELITIMKFGYVLVVITIFLMILTSSYAKEVDDVRYPPCYFNPLCSCSKAIPDLGIVRCKDIPLPSIPQTINTSKVFMLHLENNGLRYFEPFFLQSTGLYKLTVKRNPLPHIPDETFLGLERSLWELDLSHNQLTKVPNRALRYLQKLRVLDLTNNDIGEISPENWRGLENSLETLILADNSINHLPTDAFGGLPLLDTIDLRGNNLRKIDPAVFRDGMGKLAHLLLGDNQLTVIPYQAVQILKSLKTLDLSYNNIDNMQPEVNNETPHQQYNFMLSMDTLRLDYNQIPLLGPGSFQYFDNLNRTYLDGNPLQKVEENAFRQAKIRELYLRSCGLSEISPMAFDGLENYLQYLDLSGNNITMLAQDLFHRMNNIRMLSVGNNLLEHYNPMEVFNGFQFTLYSLDLSGTQNSAVNIQDLRRLRNLRFLSLSELTKPNLSPDDFMEFGMDLEELQINYAGLQSVKNNAFQFVHGIKKLDFNENSITLIEKDAFTDIGHSLVSLQLSHAFAYSVSTLPSDCFRPLQNLEELDLSNNKIHSMPATSFHFLKKLKKLELQDNNIDEVHKGTFQGDIHSMLEHIYLSFNVIRSLQQHTFVDLASLEQLHLDDNMIQNIERRAFMNLENLKRLNLKGNKINTVSYEAFQNLPELEDLDMSYNELNNFDFSMFDQVGTLAMFSVNVSHNRVSNLVVGIGGSTFDGNLGTIGTHSNIKILDMSYNNITVIGKNYFKPAMLSLTHLYLSHNTLYNATKDIFGNLPHLQYLDLSHNRLFEIDFDTFRNTKRIQVLYMSHNFVPEIPNDLFKFLLNLRVVDFSHNRFRFLPDNLFKDDGLEWLDLSNNQINRLPLTSFMPQAAATLGFLDLSWNGISSVSSGGMFERFKRLSRLDLSYNRLVQIDIAAFSKLQRLSSLDLSHNAQLVLERNGRSFEGVADTLLELGLDNVSLTYVPELPLPNLLSLSLAYNSLPTVPPEMAGNMTYLRSLNLDYNDLTAVPIVTHSLTNLRRLSLAANPITSLSNTSLLGVAEHLEELDIRGFDLNTFENGVLCKMYALKSLKMNVYHNVKNFNVPRVLDMTTGLRDLEIQVNQESTLQKEMEGYMPPKLRNITFSGLGLHTFNGDILHGIRSPTLHFAIRNTSLVRVQNDIFQNMPRVRNVTVDLEYNWQLQHFENPSTASRPNQPRRSFLKDIWMHENKLTCDCQLGWIEVWQRKRRQYLCARNPSRLSSFNEYDYFCRHANDDLRSVPCANKNNASLIEVMKTDVECGWSGATTNCTSLAVVFTLILTFILQ